MTAVVSLCPAGPGHPAALAARGVTWLEVRLAGDDDPGENPHLDLVLHDTVTAVEGPRAAGHVVLLHCVAACSRTPAVGALRRTGAGPARALAAMEPALPEAGPAGAFRAALARAAGPGAGEE